MKAVASPSVASLAVASPTIASLGMYDLPWLRGAADQLWDALQLRLRAAGAKDIPRRLERNRALDDLWLDPGLVLAQTCGLPLLTSLQGKVRLVATPCYDLPGCDGPLYRSFIIVGACNPAQGIADLRGARAVINGPDSQSGMNALRATVAPAAGGERFFAAILVSGGHRQSLAAIREGRADIAAIDCVTHGLLAAGAPDELAGTRMLCETKAVPGLPLITAGRASDASVARLRDALAAVIADPALAESRDRLHLRGIAPLSIADYAPILTMRDEATALGYAELR